MYELIVAGKEVVEAERGVENPGYEALGRSPGYYLSERLLKRCESCVVSIFKPDSIQGAFTAGLEPWVVEINPLVDVPLLRVTKALKPYSMEQAQA